MTRKVYIGRSSKCIGKTAFQILANLKNFGVGRMLTEHRFDTFPEPSFHIVKRVQTYMDPELKFGKLWCETVIRGQRLPGIRPLEKTYLSDFRLIPKDEEEQFIGGYPITNLGDKKNILPKYYQLPPLMKMWMHRHQIRLNRRKESDQEFLIPFQYQDKKDLRKPDADLFWLYNRLAEDGEKPTVEFNGKFQFNEDYLKHIK